MSSKDQRKEKGRKVAILAHCLVNQNSKPYQRARYSGIVTPVLDVLSEKGYGLCQMPCPEIAFGGLNRFSQVVEQYDTPKYHEHCRDLANRVIDQVEHYIKEDYQLILFGIEGSPSCGIKKRGSDPEWRGYPSQEPLPDEYPVDEGPGIFIQELRNELATRDLEELPEIGVGLDIPGIDLSSVGSKLESNLVEVTE